jgi:hypothetical protein
MKFGRLALILLIGLSIPACAYPYLNKARFVEVQEIVSQVECELLAASEYFPDELDKSKDDTWDIGSTLDLTLVSRVDGDGKVSWAIPLYSSVSPSAGGSIQDTVTAHVAFSTDLSEVRAKAAKNPQCLPSKDNLDPSGTGLGLASWIKTTFAAVDKDKRAGVSYTRIFELHADVGARVGYIFAPINLDVGAGLHGTKTNQLVVAITPHTGPQKVIVVADKKKTGGARLTSGVSTFSNPNIINLLNRQAPLHLLPGQQLR